MFNKKIILNIVVFIFSISNFLNCIAQEPTTSVLPKDVGKLEYKFNKDEVVVYKVSEDITVSSEHEYLKNKGGSGAAIFYLINQISDIQDDNSISMQSGGFVEKGNTREHLGSAGLSMSKKGQFKVLYPEYWFHINQPIFSDENKTEWEDIIKINLGINRPEDPNITAKVRYKIKGTSEVYEKDCLVIETQVECKEPVKRSETLSDEIELNDKSITYFDYKSGRILKMNIDHHYKITGIEGEKRLVIRDEKANIAYELSDRMFDKEQVDYILYNKVPELPFEEYYEK